MVAFQNLPTVARADAPLWGQLVGLAPQQKVTLQVSLQDDLKRTWTSRTNYRASARGRIDLAAAQPINAAWTGSDAYGPYWTMALKEKLDYPWSFEAATAELEPLTVQLTALSEGDVLAEASFERHFIFRTTQEKWRDDLTANLFLPARFSKQIGVERSAGVLVLAGSEGGFAWANQVAALIAASGRAALALAYFDWEGHYGLPRSLTEIPLELFGQALDRLKKHLCVTGDLALVGFSKGAEAALLLATKRNDISDVVAYAPSTYVWEAARLNQEQKPRSSWTWRGEPVPFASFDADESFYQNWDKTALLEFHRAAIRAGVEHARIPLEDAAANILLLSGSDDRVWPASVMSQTLLEKDGESGRLEQLTFENAGHTLTPPGLPSADRLGGTPTANAYADRKSWAALRRQLGLC